MIIDIFTRQHINDPMTQRRIGFSNETAGDMAQVDEPEVRLFPTLKEAAIAFVAGGLLVGFGLGLVMAVMP